MEKSKVTNALHWHRCYFCEDMLVCSCDDRRQFDRATGKERRIYCFGCANLEEALRAEYGQAANLERVQ